jgi:phosphatidylserine/phosphatidylglycerophosphate/cardiolipin synthase-like enzyme
MRVRAKSPNLSVHAISGTHVVCLGLDAPKEATKGLLGFAISRTNHADDKTHWFTSGRRFQEDCGRAETPDSREAPIQMFFWGDYQAEPAQTYTYTVIPMYGAPGALEEGEKVEIEITTEDTEHQQHAVFFNRGVAGSQSYSRKFGEYRRWYQTEYNGRTSWKPFIKPDDVGTDEAYKWLSRGLEEAMLGFISRAKGSKYSLRAAVYEFEHKPVIQALVDALERGVDVKITYDAKRSGAAEAGPWRATERSVREVGLKYYRNREANGAMMIQRTNATISHNKFIILLEDGNPIEVWTGSTNFTRGGIFGQSNVGHIIRDPEVAAKYLEYWETLATNPAKGTASKPGLRQWNIEKQPDLDELPPKNSMTPIFSPRPTVGMLEWYAQRVADAKQSVHFTAAFGVSREIAERLLETKKTKSPYMRYVMLESRPSEKASTKAKDAAREKGRPTPIDYYDLVEIPQNNIAFGATMRSRRVKEGQEEFELDECLTGLDTHVNFLHTKYMLVDPLTDDPLVITGSANFSQASTIDNDENMLVIRGNKRIADIFLGEFMRLFRHFKFRNEDNELSDEEAAQQWLLPDDSWTKPYYKKGSQQEAERKLFA